MEFTQLELNSRKRTSQENKHDESSGLKYRRTYQSLVLSINSPCVFFDFNQTYDNVRFQCTETSDQYRPGLPYKLLHYPLKSSVEIIFGVTNLEFLPEVHLVVNCCTGQHYRGQMDILLNNIPHVTQYTGTFCDLAFREHCFSFMKDAFINGQNILKIQLSNKSPGVFWLSDCKISGVFCVQ